MVERLLTVLVDIVDYLLLSMLSLLHAMAMVGWFNASIFNACTIKEVCCVGGKLKLFFSPNFR